MGEVHRRRRRAWQLLRWMRKLGYDSTIKSRRANLPVMTKEKKITKKESTNEDFEVFQLKKMDIIIGAKIKGCRDESNSNVNYGRYSRKGV